MTRYATYPDLAGKVAVVTGGSKGIGAATCEALAANGARIAVVARSADAVDQLVTKLGGDALAVTADCTDESALAALRGTVEAELGPVELLVPFAGGFSGFTPVGETSLDRWREIVDANLTSTFLTVREFLPRMIARQRGSIVTMGSISGRFLDFKVTASYAAAKAAVLMFTRHLALEVGEHGIRANCVAPGTTLSERVERNLDAAGVERVAALSPLGRIGMPSDTASATLFLLSDSASWLTGVTLDVSGGRVML